MLEAVDLGVSYGEREALRGVSLKLAAGELLAVVGPNGSGKSTLVRALSRVLPPTRGRVLLDGQDLYQLEPRAAARAIAVVPQETKLAFELTAAELVLLGRAPHLRRFRWENEEDYATAGRSLRLAGAQELAARAVTSLSGGERQRVTIARALAQRPRALLLDEPTAHLDLNYQLELTELMRDLAHEEGLGVLAVMHDVNLAAQYCDRALLLSEGRACAVGRPEEVVTEENLGLAYGSEAEVARHPATGRPYVRLGARRGPAVRPSKSSRIHVICGAGTGARLLGALLEAGYGVSVGAVNIEDSDQIEAARLGLARAEEAPFSDLSEEVQRANRELALASDVIVVTGVPFGRGNLSNLRTAAAALEAGRRVLLIDAPPIAGRDFCEGAAQALFRGLAEQGAETLTSEDAALEELRRLP
jgi:iron complex transport system ATP-binding protein